MPKPKQPLKQRPPPTSSDPAHAQTLPADQPLASSSSIDPPIDPLLDLHPPVIDPSLADLVNQVDQSQTKNAHNLRIGQAGHGQDGSGEGLAGPLGHGLDEELDPDWREIVNSLNQASQNEIHSPDGQPHAGPSHAASHLAEHEERDRLQQSLQSTLDDFTEENLSALFPAGFPHSPPAAHFGLAPEETTQAVASNSAPNGEPSTDPSAPTVRRGRGRPKGSKNKYKAVPKPRKPRRKKTPPPKRPRGRPPKVRDPEEQAAWEEKRARKELGIQKQKGRPRKFPGYLVREMRLRKNRDEYIRLMKEYEEIHPDPPPTRRRKNKAQNGGEVVYNDEDEVRRALEGQAFNLDQALEGTSAEQGHSGEGGDGVEGIFAQPWETQGQSLLEVVDAAAAAEAARQAEESGGGPSGDNEQAVEDMQRVFRLDGDGDETMGLDGVVEEVGR